MEVQEFKVPIGPQHPALKEPISLRMTLEGEIMKHFALAWCCQS
ncbi:MAG: hypothetical protein ABIL86_11950 [candidate division WOR-3 bacterium]